MIEGATVREVEDALRRLREAASSDGAPLLRTQLLTQVVWIPPEWEPAATAVMAGLGERQPSRTIRLFPDPESDHDALDVRVDLRCFAHSPTRAVCSEVIAIWLRGKAARAPASVVQPLLVSDLPAFLRWRGRLSSGADEFEQLVGVVDRLIVDPSEWGDPGPGYRELVPFLDRVAVSDIAWSRIEPWRRALAALWPGIARAERLRVDGPRADALLLSRWLGGRLRRRIETGGEPAEQIELVEVDGRPVRVDRLDRRSPSDLLSDQLEILGRDPIYEETLRGRSRNETAEPSQP